MPLLEAEDERNQIFLKIFETLKNIEQDFPLLLPSGSEVKNRTSQNFYQKQKVDPNAPINGYHFMTPYTGVNQL